MLIGAEKLCRLVRGAIEMPSMLADIRPLSWREEVGQSRGECCGGASNRSAWCSTRRSCEMPVYEYVCDDCGHTTEAIRSMADKDATMVCEHCGSRQTRRAL